MGLLETKIVKKVKKVIEKRFPDMMNVEPSEEKVLLELEPKVFKKLGVSLPKDYIGKELFRLSFKKLIETEDGYKMQRVVRVLVDKAGKIFKITTTK